MPMFKTKPPSKHMRELCKALGPDYSICVIEPGYVIYRDFGNGYDLEISGVNTNSKKTKASLRLWWNKERTVKVFRNVPQDFIWHYAEQLYNLTVGLPPLLDRTKDFEFFGDKVVCVMK